MHNGFHSIEPQNHFYIFWRLIFLLFIYDYPLMPGSRFLAIPLLFFRFHSRFTLHCLFVKQKDAAIIKDILSIGVHNAYYSIYGNILRPLSFSLGLSFLFLFSLCPFKKFLIVCCHSFVWLCNMLLLFW